MFKTLRDKMTSTGLIVLALGVALLIFTFASSYGFLSQSLSILTSSDLAQTFGEALAPLISTCIRVMYLGVMGWVGSLLTIRGVTILSQARQTSTIPVEEQQVAKEETKEKVKEEPKKIQPKIEEKPKEVTKKPETKPYEPEIIVLTPETLAQVQQEPQKPPQQQPQQNQAQNQ